MQVPGHFRGGSADARRIGGVVNRFSSAAALAVLMIEAIATGEWLTPRQRVRAIASLMLAATALAVAVALLTAQGTLDALGRPLGTDFSMIWNAGRMANDGAAAAAWDWSSFHSAQVRTHGEQGAREFLAWLYPPPFLLIASLVATLPYVWALVAWQAATLTPAALLARRIAPEPNALLVALGFPAVLICLGHGHNGFLTAALLGGGLFLLDRRPLVAGVLLGCLLYKPQFAVILPLVLIAGGHWRAFLGASGAVIALVGVTLAIWGWPVWQAFIDSLPQTQAIIVEQGSTGWQKIQSAFSAVRMWGGGLAFAYGAQSVVTGMAVLAAMAATRFMAANLRGAAVIAGALLSTPYLLDYDLVVLGIAIAFLVADGRARGFLRWEASILAFVWAVPLFARTLMAATGIPFGLVAIGAILVLTLRRGVILDGALARLRSSPFRHSRAASAR